MRKFLLLPLILSSLQLVAAESKPGSIEKHQTSFGLKPKSFEYLIDKMPKFNKELIEVHLRLYRGYVKQVNVLNNLLKEKSIQKDSEKQSVEYNALKSTYGFEYNGMILHEYYFSNLGSDEPLSKNSVLYKRIKQQWGNYDNWLADFKRTSMGRGPGWAILYYEPQSNTFYNAWVSDHADGPLVGAIPILVIDLWEHAYLCQYGTDKKAYLETIIGYVDWSVLNQRLKTALSSSKAKQVRTVKPEKAKSSDKCSGLKSDGTGKSLSKS